MRPLAEFARKMPQGLWARTSEVNMLPPLPALVAAATRTTTQSLMVHG